MRYVKMHETFWTGETGREIRALGLEAQVVAHYLINNRHANMTGLYLLPLMYISADTGIPIEAPSKPLRSPFNGVNNTLRSLCEAGFCSYDYDTETIFVHEMAKYQIGDYLRENDKRVKGIENILLEHSKCPLLNDFLKKYADVYCLHGISPIEAPSKPLGKPLRSQTTVTDNSNRKQTTVTESKNPPGPPKGTGSVFKSQKDFDHFWKSYPKKVGKQAAIRSWEKTNKIRPELDFILMALEQQKKSKQWAKDGGQYIPNPATWLSQGRWDDEAPEGQDVEDGFVRLPGGRIVSEITAHNIKMFKQIDENEKNGKKGIFDGFI